MEELIPAKIVESIVEPKSTSNTQKEWFIASELHMPDVLNTNAHDLAFFFVHNDKKKGLVGHILIRSIAR